MIFSKNAFLNLTRAFALALCTALLLNFVSCSDSSTSQDPKVKIILDANGGSFSETTGKTETTQTLLIKKNQASKLSTADELGLSRENHNFTGWAKSQQGEVEYDDGADITSSTDLTLYAQWEAVNSTYTVRHLLQNLQDDEYTEDSTEQESGKSGTKTSAAAKSYEGYTAQTFEQATIQADGSTVVEIKYDRNTYTISYSSTYGEPPASKPVKYGYKLTVADLPDLKHADYSFNGWLLDGASIAAEYTVKKDIILTALWNEIIANYTVKHLLQNVQDDSYTEDSTEQKSGKSGTQTAAAAKTYEGFTAKTIEQKTIQADGSTVIDIYYDRNTYTVSYNSTYGEPPASKPVRYGYVLETEDLPVLSVSGYSFNGWVYENTSIEAGYTVTGAITLTAQWKAVNSTYTIKHLLQNLQDDRYTEEAAEQKSGKTGTQTVAAAKSYEGFTAKTFAQKTIQADGSTVVEIKYDRNTYTLSYSSTYGEPPASKTVKYEYVLTAANLPDLTQTNYSFKGWFLDGASIEAGYTVKTDITLTAQWEGAPSTYTIKHLLQNLQNDSYTEDEEATEQKSGIYGTQTVAAAKTYEGFTAKTFTQATIQADGSTVVEIHYDRNTYTVSYSSTYGDTPQAKTVKYGYVLTAADLPDLTQTNYSFKDWRLDGASIEAGYTVKKAITLTALWEVAASTYFVTKENFSTVIAALTENSTIVLTGELTDSDLTTLKTAIKNSTYNVNLDLSQTTGLTSIPNSTFRDCPRLSGITIPDSVTSIGSLAFYWCKSLTSVTIPESVTSIGNQTFDNCTSLSSVTIGGSVTSIGSSAFFNCTSLSSVTIPESVTSIGSQAFSYCTSLRMITVDSNNANYSSIDGVLFNKDATDLIQYPTGKQSDTYTIPDSVTSIGSGAFNNCKSLSSVIIPNSVTSIGFGAFEYCTSLSSVTIPDSVTSIGNYAFSCCYSLSSVTIPDSVTSIGYYAFYGWSKLTSISFIDTTTWYRTTYSSNWNNKTGGTLTDVSDPATNATYFKDTYKDCYWYKR